jgi:predicted N-formylglutamate amidohydrolase
MPIAQNQIQPVAIEIRQDLIADEAGQQGAGGFVRDPLC